MLEFDVHPRPERHPVIALLLITAYVFLGFVILGPIVGFVLSLPFFSGTMFEYLEAIQDPTRFPQVKTPLYILQGCATFIGLVVAPALYLKTERKSLKSFFTQSTDWTPIVLTTAIVIVFMVVNSIFIEWNAAIQLPEFLKGFEAWAKEKEDAATKITELLTKFNSTADLAIALIVIAILPAIGEEFVFRGLIQNEFYRGTKNIHVSIWISAILFSAIHVQFYGFVPRMLLGALFGYIYYWSGSLTLSMLAHFVNNGFSVIALYYYQQGTLKFDMEGTEAAPGSAVLFCAVITFVLLYYFRKFYLDKKSNPSS